MKKLPLLLLFTHLVLAPICWADSASWNITTDGNWALNSNWTAPYPNGSDQIATLGAAGFSATNQVRTVTLDGDIVLGGLSITGGSNSRYVVSGSNTLTLTNTSGTVAISSGASGNPAANTLAVPITLNTTTLNLSGRLLEISGNISASLSAPDSTINVSATSGGVIAFSGNNNFGNGNIYLNDAGALNLKDNANSGGGANTKITFNNNSAKSILSLSSASAASVDYKNDIVVSGTAGGEIVLNRTGGAGRTYSLGSLSVNANRTLEVKDNGSNSAQRSSLRVNSGEVVTIQSGGLLLAYDSVTNAASTKNVLILSTNTKLVGSGTIATMANGTSLSQIQLESGATFSPGDTAVASFSIGNATYNDTQMLMDAGSNFRFDLAGIAPGTGYDQVTLYGDLTITSVNLILALNYQYANSDKAFLITNEAVGSSITGMFAGLADGALVNLGIYGGAAASARISYFGNADLGTITGGNDVVLYDFAVVPEPSSFALVALAGGLLVTRFGRRMFRRA